MSFPPLILVSFLFPTARADIYLIKHSFSANVFGKQKRIDEDQRGEKCMSMPI